MHCPACNSVNRDSAKFCAKCGLRIDQKCSNCGSIVTASALYCDNCGYNLKEQPAKESPSITIPDGERKYVTALFCDLSGFTSLSEKLDPEELKEVIAEIFGSTAHIIAQYGGFVEKSIGDATMALFGAIQAHEDDPIRAVKAARDIHEMTRHYSSAFKRKAGGPVTMHTGINTGLVVTGEINVKDGTHGVLGETLNVAARLVNLAGADEIIVGPETYRQAEGYFHFEKLAPTEIKGKSGTVQIYKVLSPKDDPVKTHRLSGLRAQLIGRKSEMAQLMNAALNIKNGKGSIYSIIGDIGTGKSRLIEEFKAALDPGQFQWHEGHCYAYTHNIPYFPLKNLLSRAWNIKENDPPELIRQKLDSLTNSLVGDRKELLSHMGRLYSIPDAELDQASPEAWKAGLHRTFHQILGNLCRSAPTIICVEDLHWADPSSIELLKTILNNFAFPALFICVYRPYFSLFSGPEIGRTFNKQEIVLDDLSPTDSQIMVESLLDSEHIPGELRHFIRDKIEGNPFYLEEVVTTLLETEVLKRREGEWVLERPALLQNIPATVQGLITARLDRLEAVQKRILQEASVIGRSFLYDILNRTTELKDYIEGSLTRLERMDLIHTRTMKPYLEYIFKHVITQEVVYNGLLKKERLRMHEKVAVAIEELFHDRRPEFYEVLAYHYKQGQSVKKAINYLVKSAEKCLRRFAIDEAHEYYSEAFSLLDCIPDKTEIEKNLLVDILLDWAVIYYRRARFVELVDLLKKYEGLVLSLGNEEKTGMFYGRLGGALTWTNDLRDSYGYLSKALSIGERIGNEKVIGCASVFIPWCYADLGLLEEAVNIGKRAQQLELYKTDLEFYRHLSFYIAYASYFRGDVETVRNIGLRVLDFAEKHSRPECYADAYLELTFADLISGDVPSAIKNAKDSYRFSLDPLIKITATTFRGMSCAAAGRFEEAQAALIELKEMTSNFNSKTHGTVGKLYSGIVTVINGDLDRGLGMIMDVMNEYEETGLKYRYAVCNHLLGQIYSQLASGEGKKSLSLIAKNLGFLFKNLPFAAGKAESHFRRAIAVSEEIGAEAILGQSWLDMGIMYRAKKDSAKSRECISKAIKVFEKNKADVFLKKARGLLQEYG